MLDVPKCIAVVFSPDRRFLITGLRNGSIKVCDFIFLQSHCSCLFTDLGYCGETSAQSYQGSHR